MKCEAKTMKRDAKYKKLETERGPRGFYRTDFLFAAGSIAVIAGLFFPLRAHVLDVFLVFGTSLTAAVLVIALSAQGALQVQSFPLLIVLVTTLRMALCVACAKLILLHGNAGTIV
ncbi:MAG: FHIPEP family type III secretion protein, partial [Planctomycetota bacterium]